MDVSEDAGSGAALTIVCALNKIKQVLRCRCFRDERTERAFATNLGNARLSFFLRGASSSIFSVDAVSDMPAKISRN